MPNSMSLSLKGRKMDLMQSAVGICWTGNKASLMREEFKELPMVCRCMSDRGAGEQRKVLKRGRNGSVYGTNWVVVDKKTRLD